MGVSVVYVLRFACESWKTGRVGLDTMFFITILLLSKGLGFCVCVCVFNFLNQSKFFFIFEMSVNKCDVSVFSWALALGKRIFSMLHCHSHTKRVHV